MYCDDFDADRAEAVLRAQEAGVSHLVLPNEDLDSLKRIQAMHEHWPSFTSMAIGLHPEDVDAGYRQVLEQMKPLAASGQYVAVGEVGIDLYWDATWRSQQVEALAMQLEWCRDYNLPFIIHCRNGLDECLEAIDRVGGDKLRGVMHSFTGTVADVERVRRHGDFYFGVNGIVTFKKAKCPTSFPPLASTGCCLKPTRPIWRLCHIAESATRAPLCHLCAKPWHASWAPTRPKWSGSPTTMPAGCLGWTNSAWKPQHTAELQSFIHF